MGWEMQQFRRNENQSIILVMTDARARIPVNLYLRFLLRFKVT